MLASHSTSASGAAEKAVEQNGVEAVPSPSRAAQDGKVCNHSLDMPLFFTSLQHVLMHVHSSA